MLLTAGCGDTALPAGPAPAPTAAPTSTAAPTAAPTSTELPGIGGSATQIRAIDGDTLAVDPDGPGSEVRIRVLGVNTPERGDCGYREATQYVTSEIPPGTRVLLIPDAAQGNSDRYGRWLRYVRIPAPDGSFTRDLSVLLAEAGWAEHYDRYPVSESPQIIAAQERAQAAGRGKWALCAP